MCLEEPAVTAMGHDEFERGTPIREPWRPVGYVVMRCCRALEWRHDRVDMASRQYSGNDYLHKPEYCDLVKAEPDG